MADQISKKARGVLVFPSVVKAGLVFGGSYGEGVLKRGTTVIDYYNSVSGSWGLQVGAQSYSYVVFLMNDNAMDYIAKSQGWEIGVGPTVVLVNEGVAKNLSTSTLKNGASTFIFEQEGLMVSLTIEEDEDLQVQSLTAANDRGGSLVCQKVDGCCRLAWNPAGASIPTPTMSEDRSIATLEMLVAKGADVNARITDVKSRTARMGRGSTLQERGGQSALFGARCNGAGPAWSSI